VVLTDVSTNGTWINEEATPIKDQHSTDARGAKERRLHDGDIVKLYKSGTLGTPPCACFTFRDLRSERVVVSAAAFP
jgi:hypothetical protein